MSFIIKFISFGVSISGKNIPSSTTPISSLIIDSYFLLFLSNIFISPYSGFIIFKMDFINVVFPAPFSPIKPIIYPLGISKLISPSSKLLSYFFFKFLISIALLIILHSYI